MIRLYALLTLSLMAISGFIGYQLSSGKEAKQDIKIIKKQVVNHNEDALSIEKDSKNVAEKQAEHKESLERIPLVIPDTTCACDNYERLYNESNAVANSVHFED